MAEPNFVLYARPSFFEGLARLLDVGGTLNEYNTSKSPEEADYRAIFADWQAVGLDIDMAIKLLEKEDLEKEHSG